MEGLQKGEKTSKEQKLRKRVPEIRAVRNCSQTHSLLLHRCNKIEKKNESQTQ